MSLTRFAQTSLARSGASGLFKSIIRNIKLISICLVFGSGFLASTSLLPEGQYEWIRDALRALGSGFIALGGASVIYDHLVVNRSLLRMFKILGATTASEIEMLHSDRQAASEDIAEALRTAKGQVRIMAIAMTDFFYAATDRRLFERTAQFCKVSCLLLHPNCEEARHRASKEDLTQEHYSRTELFRNAEMAISNLQALKRNPGKGASPNQRSAEHHVKVRFYKREPTMFLAITDEWVFFEPYHLGSDETRDPSVLTVCLGKHVPITKVSARSALGVQLKNYFDSEMERWNRDECKLQEVSKWVQTKPDSGTRELERGPD